MADKLSYRQAGKATAGVLMRGKLTGQGSAGKNFSTIPSKFETTLFTGNKEQDGFGSRAHRFVDLENDLPGPGTYDEHDKKVMDHRVYSKKGLGVGFVSKVKRESAFKGNAAQPGPGSYERGATFVDMIQENNRSNRSGSTSTFKPPSTKSVVVASDPLPGPGNYELHREFDHEALTMGLAGRLPGHSVFRSNTKRGVTIPAGRRPAPGTYDPHHVRDGVDPTLPSSAFRSSVPNAGAMTQQKLTREQQLGVVQHQRAYAPGPGDYEASTAAAASVIQRRMPQFADTSHDRFGKTATGVMKLDTPGPGAYLHEEERPRAVISDAVFMSGTSRSTGPREVVPGPAYYSPAPNPRKSYHLNARQRWMPSL
uniref:Uncharacterized protein n=1 Tax=Haptolina brevifila TaxID=156173 RepID=A0A7S2IH04_9EUKA|mmetsp:Transcript_66025/g.130925  ORF Transcript_66025/g.130925 Transcript_66025/m.130925 type:complete len:368 (+) Transcript_66025:63-1166(+)